MEFIHGRELCRRFFEDIVGPLLTLHFPNLTYTAGLLGYGSDVLGYDDPTSTDHMWGPRFYLFLEREDLSLAPAIEKMLSENLPTVFCGYSVNFSEPDPGDNGVRHAEFVDHGPVHPLCWIETFEDFFEQYLGFPLDGEPDFADWLSFSEHRLLALSRADLYRDDLNIAAKLAPYARYPEDVRIWLMASQWSLISEEQAFPGRCAMTGDNLGSRLAISRMVSRLMRIAFLCAGEYAPYSKWFGTAFSRLPLPIGLAESLSDAMTARKFPDREQALIRAQLLTAELQNQTVFGAELTVERYFGRSMLVVHPEKMADGLAEKLGGSPLAKLPLCGGLSELENLSVLWDDPQLRPAAAAFYRSLGRD
ncbi:MAG: DUF4037 domain-containing protein [Oscillospiraceae bacterium]|nr:DUF4037 domain-containing protein [Oscillospiraceae bacterium]